MAYILEISIYYYDDMPLLVLFSCAMENKKGLIVFDKGQNGGGVHE